MFGGVGTSGAAMLTPPPQQWPSSCSSAPAAVNSAPRSTLLAPRLLYMIEYVDVGLNSWRRHACGGLASLSLRKNATPTNRCAPPPWPGPLPRNSAAAAARGRSPRAWEGWWSGRGRSAGGRWAVGRTLRRAAPARIAAAPPDQAGPPAPRPLRYESGGRAARCSRSCRAPPGSCCPSRAAPPSPQRRRCCRGQGRALPCRPERPARALGRGRAARRGRAPAATASRAAR